jgi:peptidoglycan/LPS O-acetylase OafA/YrhL
MTPGDDRPGRPRFSDIVARAHFPALDGLRAVAVALVILGHVAYPVPGIPGDLGVSAFFVLSGFLITRLLMREHDANGSISLPKFYARRTLRIFPAYYVFLAFSFTLDRFLGDHWPPALGASAVTYTVNYYNALNAHPPTSVAHAWSLAVEEQFYLLWPLAFLLLARRGRAALIAGAATAAVLALGWRSWLALFTATDVAYLYNAFDTRFDNLAVGCLLALLADARWVTTAAERVARRSWYPLVTIVLLAVSRVGLSESYHYSAGFTVDALLVAVLIVQLMQLTRRPAWAWLDSRPARFLGVISYPIYLYHAWGAAVGHRAPFGGETGVFVLTLVATLLLASGSYFVVEKPFLRLKRRFQPRSVPAPDTPVPGA